MRPRLASCFLVIGLVAITPAPGVSEDTAAAQALLDLDERVRALEREACPGRAGAPPVAAAARAAGQIPCKGGRPEAVEAFMARVLVSAMAARMGVRLPPLRVTAPSPSDRDLATHVEEAERGIAHSVRGGPEALVAALLAMVPDQAADVGARCIAIRVLERVRGERLAPVLARMAREGRPGLALWEALVALGRTGGAGAAGPLVVALGRLKGWGRQYAIVGLRLSGARPPVDPVMAALEDPEPAVRRHAARYLAAVNEPRVRRRLLAVSRTDPDPTTREVTGRALRTYAWGGYRGLRHGGPLGDPFGPYSRLPVSVLVALDAVERVR